MNVRKTKRISKWKHNSESFITNLQNRVRDAHLGNHGAFCLPSRWSWCAFSQSDHARIPVVLTWKLSGLWSICQERIRTLWTIRSWPGKEETLRPIMVVYSWPAIGWTSTMWAILDGRQDSRKLARFITSSYYRSIVWKPGWFSLAPEIPASEYTSIGTWFG